MSRFIMLAMFGFVFQNSVAVSSDVEYSTTLTTEVKAHLKRVHDAIDSVEAVCRSSGYSAAYPKGFYSYQRTVAKAPGSVFAISAHGHDTLDWRDDFLQQVGYQEERRFVNWNPVNRTYVEEATSATDPLPGRMEQSFLFVAMGIWPLTSRPAFRPHGQPLVLREIATSPDFLARRNTEIRNGLDCVVLESTKHGQRLWIDLNKNCAVVAREFDDQVSHELMQVYDCRDLYQIGGAFWAPKSIRVKEYNTTAENVADRKTLVRDGVVDLELVRINEVTPDRIVFKPPPGSVCVNDEGRPSIIAPGGHQGLVEMAAWLRRNDSSNRLGAKVAPDYGALGLLVIGILSFCYSLGGFILFRVRASTIAETTPMNT